MTKNNYLKRLHFTRGLSYSLGVSCGLFNSVLWCSAVFRHTALDGSAHDHFATDEGRP